MPAIAEKQQAEFITDRAKAAAWLDDMALRYLGVPYAEFLRRLDRGEYDREQPEVVRLAMLRDLAA